MDLALLAVTALGFVGVFLLLPRERPTMARIGGLVGILALATLFLLLVRRTAEAGVPVEGAPSIFFYVFAAIMIAGSIGVICHPRPVYAALYFVLVTLAGAGIFVLLLAEFVAIVLIIVYAGAILVTYVFVIMLATQAQEGSAKSPEYDRLASEPLVAVLVSFVLLGTVLQVMYPAGSRAIAQPAKAQEDRLLLASQTQPTTLPVLATTGPAAEPYQPGNMAVLGASLYGKYVYPLELAGILLTIALVGAVVIARKNVELEEPIGTGDLPPE